MKRNAIGPRAWSLDRVLRRGSERPPSGPLFPVIGVAGNFPVERPSAEPPPRRGVQGTGQRGRSRGNRRLAQPAGRPLARDEIDVDAPRRIRHSTQPVSVEVGLLHASPRDGNFLVARCQQCVDDAALDLRNGPFRIHHDAAIHGRRDSVDDVAAAVGNGQLDDLGHIRGHAPVTGDAPVSPPG